MKRILRILIVPLCVTLIVFVRATAQESMLQPGSQQLMDGGFGATLIDGQTYYLFNLMPEFSFGKLGLGLDLNIRVNSQTGKIRSEDYQNFNDYLRVIRYVRWGVKQDPVYVRAGVLDYAQLGHGFIMYNYENSASYDLRKWGLEFDMDMNQFGFETIYSDLAGRGILGGRAYVRPLRFTDAGAIPVIGGFEVGWTYAADLNADASKTLDPTTGAIVDGGAMRIMGFDVGLPLLSLSAVHSTLYYDYAKIINYGRGSAVGIDFHFAGMGLFTLRAKYERRFLKDQFLPSYFDALYEHDRYIPTGTNTFVSKAEELQAAKAAEGYYGELTLGVLGAFNVLGGYYAPLGVQDAGTLHLVLQTPTSLPLFIVSGGYDKKDIGSVFKVDNNSLLYAQVGYKLNSFLLLSTLYQWTFTEVKDANGNVIGYATQRRVEPKLSVVFNF